MGFQEPYDVIFYFFRVLLLETLWKKSILYIFLLALYVPLKKSYMLLMDDLLLCCIYMMNTYSAFECFRRCRGNYVSQILQSRSCLTGFPILCLACSCSNMALIFLPKNLPKFRFEAALVRITGILSISSYPQVLQKYFLAQFSCCNINLHLKPELISFEV